MYTRILVPLDGSLLSEQVVPYVNLLAKPLGCAVDLMRVIVPVPAELADRAQGSYIDQMAANFSERARQSLDEMKISLEASGVQVSTVLPEGNPESLIVDEAAKVPEGLIAMSTHGRSGMSRIFMGSVTDKVLRAADNPLLVIRSYDPEPEPEPEADAATVKLANIIVPLDGSALAEQVLPHVTEIAKALSLNVILIRVSPTSAEYYSHFAAGPVNGAPGVLNEAAEEMSRLAFTEAGEYLEEQKKRLEGQGIQSVRLWAVRGRATDAVWDIAKETPDSMVAMMTHGRSGLGRWVLGSVAERVMRYSGRPVLMVRGKE